MPLVSLIFLLLTPFLSSSPDLGPLFDAYSTGISIKQENGRLDNYAIQLKSSPEIRALIVVYAESENSGRSGRARARRAVRYLVKTRRLNPARIVWRFEGVCKHNVIFLYLLYPTDADPPRDTTCMR